jgi:class 3 adenylate cyclase
MDRYTLVFDDVVLERRFRGEFTHRRARAARLAISAGAPGYLLIWLIVDEADARRLALAAVGVLALWVALSWTQLYERRFELITITAVLVLTVLTMAIPLALPSPSAAILLVAYGTLNFIWIFMFLRPRFPYAFGLGLVFLLALVTTGTVVWDRFGAGDAPNGMIDLLGGKSGGLLIVSLYGGFLFVLSASIAYRLEHGERADFLLRAELDAAYEQTERLLTNVLPVSVAERLKSGENPIADDCTNVTVVFADISGFTTMSRAMRPAAVLELLNEVFTRFDRLASAHGLEKIKTIGDAYMAAAGVPEPMPDHAAAAADMALDMLDVIADVRRPDGTPLDVRVGIGSGPAVAGVIGTSKFIYDLWGDTVNTASRMESHGVVGRIQVCGLTRQLLEGRYRFEPRGPVPVKGMGSVDTWFLIGK